MLPAGLTGCSAEGDGSPEFADEIVIAPPRMLDGLPEAPPYSSMPAPPAQQTMPEVSNLPGGAGGDAAILVWIAVSGGIALALVGAVLFVLRRRARAER